jgi:hypothetical protein
VIEARELMPRQHVVVKETAVIDNARDQLHVVALSGGQDEFAGPRFQRVEDHHRPVDRVAEPLEAVDQIEREPVRRPRCHSDQLREALVTQRAHAIPDSV